MTKRLNNGNKISFGGDDPKHHEQLVRLAQAAARRGKTKALREAKVEAACRKAIGVGFDALVIDKPDAERAAIFAKMELAVTAAERRNIAKHPLRPAATDAIVEKELAACEAAANDDEDGGDLSAA